MGNEELENFNETVADLEDEFLNPSLIMDNKIIIPHGSLVMRVRMPEQWEQSQAENAQNSKKIELLSSGKAVSKKNLIKLLKDNNVVDIDKLEDDKEQVVKKLQGVWVSLAVRHSSEEKSIEELKDEANLFKMELKKLSLTIANHLIPSLETQEEKAYIECITSLCTEKGMGKDVWAKKWESFADYQKEDPKITDMAITYMTWLLLNTRG